MTSAARIATIKIQSKRPRPKMLVVLEPDDEVEKDIEIVCAVPSTVTLPEVGDEEYPPIATTE